MKLIDVVLLSCIAILVIIIIYRGIRRKKGNNSFSCCGNCNACGNGNKKIEKCKNDV